MQWREKPAPLRSPEHLFDAEAVDDSITTMAEGLLGMEALLPDHPLRAAHTAIFDRVIDGDVLVHDVMAASNQPEDIALEEVVNERKLRSLLTSPFQVIKGARKSMHLRRDPAMRAFEARTAEDVILLHTQNMIKLAIVYQLGEDILRRHSVEAMAEDALDTLDRLSLGIDENSGIAGGGNLTGSQQGEHRARQELSNDPEDNERQASALAETIDLEHDPSGPAAFTYSRHYFEVSDFIEQLTASIGQYEAAH